jgi:SAM-dependent methyltransferase
MSCAVNWRDFWNARAALPDQMAAAGRSSTKPGELFALLGDVWRKLGLSRESSVLDVGCGNGIIGRHLSPLVRSYVGLDLAEWQLVRGGPGSGMRVQGRANALPFSDGTFSHVLGVAVLQYLGPEEMGFALREAFRVLMPGGSALFAMNPWVAMKPAYERSTPKSVSEESRAATAAATWCDRAWLRGLALAAGFWEVLIMPMDANVWQSWYMFDMVCHA